MKRTPPAPETPAFIKKQYEFAAHIRNPARNARPSDVEERRMAIYRELFYNNVRGILESSFPVLHEILSGDAWERLVRDFLAEHRAKTPYFREIAEELLTYLGEERVARADDPPFLYELAHYEWVELALMTAEDDELDETPDPHGDPLEGRPVVSPLAWVLEYRFPVHRISREQRPEAPGEQPTYLVVYRDAAEEVGFLEVNPVTAMLLQLIETQPELTGREALEHIAAELQHPNPRAVVEGGREILRRMAARGIVLGARPARDAF